MSKNLFLELVNRNDEFGFSFNNVEYELINGDENGNGNGVSLYLSDGCHGKLLQTFRSKEEFLQQARIDGYNISEIIDKIII